MRRRLETWGATFRDLQLHFRSLVEIGASSSVSDGSKSLSPCSAACSATAKASTPPVGIVHGNATVSPVQPVGHAEQPEIDTPSRLDCVEGDRAQTPELHPQEASPQAPPSGSNVTKGETLEPAPEDDGFDCPGETHELDRDQTPKLPSECMSSDFPKVTERLNDGISSKGKGVDDEEVAKEVPDEKWMSTPPVMTEPVKPVKRKYTKRADKVKVAASDQPTVKRKRGRPRKNPLPPAETPLKDALPAEKPEDVTPARKRKVVELMTEEEKEALMWERLEKMEKLQETNAKKGKGMKKKAVKEDADSDAHFVMPVNLEELEADEEVVVDEPDEFRHVWRDANFAIQNSVDNIMEQAKRITAMQAAAPNSDCEHEFIFKEDIGRVCIDCGLVDKLVTDHFELAKPLKRMKTDSGKKPRLQNRSRSNADHCSDEEEHESLSDEEEMSPTEFHLKRMHEHQKEGFRFIVSNLFGKSSGGVFLHHAPGTGKTFLVISFLQKYFYKFPDRRVLIAVPKNIIESWEREFRNWEDDHIPVKILSGEDRLNTVSNWYDGTGVLLVTPNLLGRLLDERKEDPSIMEIRDMLTEGPHLLVVDEAHVACNSSAKIFSSLSSIRTRQRIFLSGTAFQNNLDEVFDLLMLCRPNFISRSAEYEQAPDKGYKQFFKKTIQERLTSDPAEGIRAFRRLTEPFVQWYGGKVLEKLEGLEDFVVILKLSEAHTMQLNQWIVKSGRRLEKDHELSQVCVHPCLFDEEFCKENQDPYAGVKTTFIFELLRFVGNRERVIIFCLHIKPLALIKQMLQEEFKWSEGEEILHIDGQTAQSERMLVTDMFNTATTKARVLLASLLTCGEGISLVGGSRVVVLDTAWNPSKVRQGVSRAFRIGQTKKVYVYRLLAAETDEIDKLKISLDKEYLGRALFDTGFNIEGKSEISRVDRTEDTFLNQFFKKNGSSCIGIYATP